MCPDKRLIDMGNGTPTNVFREKLCCVRLFFRETEFCMQKRLMCFLEPFFQGRRGNIHLELLIRKPMVDFLLVIIGLLSLTIAETLVL